MTESEIPDAPIPSTAGSGAASEAVAAPASRRKRGPGEASDFADGRGGPGNYSGTNYQAWYGVLRIVDWLHDHWTDPTAIGSARCEARVVQVIRDEGPDPQLRYGQHGFDSALTGVADKAPDYREVKRAPSKDEVIKLLASLGHLPPVIAGQPILQVGLVAESTTRDYNRIERLYRLAGETTSDAELTELVAQTGDDILAELLNAIGPADAPGRRKLLRDRMVEPVLWSGTQLMAHVEKLTNLLAGSPTAGERLRDSLFRRVVDASQVREALALADLRQGLIQDGLMHGGPATVAAADPENEDLYRLLVLLETCPVSVPKALLALAMRMETYKLEEQYSEGVASGLIQEANDAWSRVPSPGARLATRFGHPLLGAVLRGLLDLAEMGAPATAGQTLNALALSQACFDADRDTVARIFKAFDKPSKAWGDLSVVLMLAELSMEALEELLSHKQSNDLMKDYAQIRAQTWICGHGWVYQRVDEFGQAVIYMGKAQELAEYYDDVENRAFTMKCQGRLHRMDAESTTDDTTRVELMAKSETMLRDAVQAFDELVITNVRKKEENHGESVSLLARTLATGQKVDEALEAIELAEQLLAGYKTGKAYGDLVILRAEVFHLSTADGQSEERATHIATLNALLERHDRAIHTPGAGSDRSASELAARLHRTVGLLHEPADPDAAAASYRRAAEVYEAMDYAPGREAALWDARMISGAVIPRGLLAALSKVSASPGVCLRAVDHATLLSTSAAGRDTMAASDEGSETNWDDIVHKAQMEQAAATPRWGPGRASA